MNFNQQFKMWFFILFYLLGDLGAQTQNRSIQGQTNQSLQQEMKRDALPDSIEKWVENFNVDVFEQTLKRFIDHKRKYWDQVTWWKEKYKLNTHKKLDRDMLLPHMQKMIVPAGSQLAMFGDLHGDYQLVVESLKYFRDQGLIKQDGLTINTEQYPNFYIIFAGDYTDRGYSPMETLAVLYELSIRNPNNVILIRGNHEDVELNRRMGKGNTGIVWKLEQLNKSSLISQVALAYEYLPMVMYLGTKNESSEEVNYIQINHGGLELAFNPKEFLQQTNQYNLFYHFSDSYNTQSGFDLIKDKFKNSQMTISKHKRALQWTTHNGWMWGDFLVDTEGGALVQNSGRGVTNVWDFGEDGTRFWLDQCSTNKVKLKAVVRAHQQSDPLIGKMIALTGTARLWSEWPQLPVLSGKDYPIGETLVFTLDVAPFNRFVSHKIEGKILPGFSYHGHVSLLTTSESYDNWLIRVYRFKSWEIKKNQTAPTMIKPQLLKANTPLTIR